MDDYIYDSQDTWEYGTGSTQPPKSRGGLIAVLLIAVIFLTGIVTVLGILNVRLVKQLGMGRPSRSPGISFSDAETRPLATDPAEELLTADAYGMDLQPVPASPEAVAQGPLTLQQIYQQNIPSVVSISCRFPGGTSAGTGVVLTADGFLVTNAHVIEDAQEIGVLLTDGRQFVAQVVGTDAVTDLAVLRIDAQDLIPAVFGDSDQAAVGDTVVAIGDPLGIRLRGTMTDGIISAISRDLEVDGRVMTLLQTNAALNSGNSGGPLINLYGQVIGINTMKIGDYVTSAGVEGLGFAIPSATVKTIVDQLISQGYVSGRPLLGITGESLSPFYQHYYLLPAGLYITSVETGSPADLAGILPRDILLTLDGVSITSQEDLDRLLLDRQVGDKVILTLYRAGKQGRVELTLTEDMG